jgi:hypothetical protein
MTPLLPPVPPTGCRDLTRREDAFAIIRWAPTAGWILGILLVAGTARCDPGAIFEKRREAIVKKFDRDGDGRLDPKEREAARAFKKAEAGKGGGGNPLFQLPPEIVEMYDKDGDGQLNAEESAAASDGIRVRWGDAQKEYDANGDGNLDDAERTKLGEAILMGKVKGLPRMFGSMLLHPPGGPRGMFGGKDPADSPLKAFDVDQDGRLNATELEAARKAGMGHPPSR